MKEQERKSDEEKMKETAGKKDEKSWKITHEKVKNDYSSWFWFEEKGFKLGSLN